MISSYTLSVVAIGALILIVLLLFWIATILDRLRVIVGGAPRFLDSVGRLFLWSSFRGEARQEAKGSLIPKG